MTFRFAITASFLVLIGTIVGATVGAVSWVIERDARGAVATELDRARQVFEHLQEYRTTLYRSEARLTAEEPRLKAVVSAEDVSQETIMGVGAEMRRALQSDVFVVLDGEGHVVADIDDPKAEGTDLAKDDLVVRAAAAGESSGIWTRAGQAFQVQLRRVGFARSVSALLAIGYRLDHRLAEGVYEQTGSSLVIEFGDRPIAISSLGQDVSASEQEIATQLALVPTNHERPVEVSLGGSRFLALARVLGGDNAAKPLRYVVLRSLDVALAASRRLIAIVCVVAAVALVGAMMAASALSRKLSQPLSELVSFTEQVASGKLETRATSTGASEIRTLASAMNRMVGELEQSRVDMVTRQRLQKEMELATQIQTAVLPKSPRARNLEIGARMVTASEVGGDYYDVLPLADGCFIGIGDVAGHGLNAGLIMMMVQSMIAVTTVQSPGSKPSDLLTSVNSALYENVRSRLGHDDHVTFSLLRYYDDGRVVLSGAHEEIIVWRKKTRRCERISTPGGWLGVIAEGRQLFTDTSFALEPGDVMVLYTDGITEAMSPERVQFGVARICSELESVPELPAQGICAHMLEVAQVWSKKQERVDDMTIVVLRYLGEDDEDQA